MSEIAVLHSEIDTLPQNRVGEVLNFVCCLKQQEAQQDMDEPNEETIAAIEETRAMARGEIPSPTFNSLEELLAELVTTALPIDSVSEVWYIQFMDKDSCVIYQGPIYSLEWYYDKKGNSSGYDYFLGTTQDQKRKLLILVKRMGDFGKIYDKTKFRNEGDGIFAFKPQPDRYLSFFTDDKKIITNGFIKKTDKLPKNEKDLALKLRQDYYGGKTGESA